MSFERLMPGNLSVSAEQVVYRKVCIAVMIWALSQQPARRNCSTGEDAGYPQLDGKTPWSFTVA